MEYPYYMPDTDLAAAAKHRGAMARGGTGLYYMICTCGWESYPTATHPDDVGPVWYDHVNDVVPELALEDMTRQIESLKRAATHKVAELRHRGISWDRIGAAAGMRRQSAREKWMEYDQP